MWWSNDRGTGEGRRFNTKIINQVLKDSRQYKLILDPVLLANENINKRVEEV